MNQTMNDLALLAIGIGFGLAIGLVAVMVFVLYRTATSFSRTTNAALSHSADALAANKLAMQQLRGEVSVGLSKIDAEKMYSASLQLQRLVKSLGQQVDTMQKALYAQPPAPAIDWTSPGTGMDTEAEDDARMLAERNRWRAPSSSTNPDQYVSPTFSTNDPLAGLSEEERRLRTLEYFERRRAATAGFPYVGPSNPLSSTPPTAGSGIYASLLDEANQRPPASSVPLDFSGLQDEEGVELSEKGELG